MFCRIHAPAIAPQRFAGTLDSMEHAQTPRVFSRPLALSLVAIALATVVSAASPARQETTSWRTYRADANVMLFGFTLLSRGDVGGGFARLTETPFGSQNDIRLLFVSGSRPDRAHGMSRMGFIQESVTEMDTRPSHAEYLGFMTSSGEESLSEAKRALHGPTGENMQFVASRGEIAGGNARHTVHRMLLPASTRWIDTPHVLSLVEDDLDHPGNDAKYADLSHGERPGTFLYTVLTMVRSPNRTNDGTFLHNGKLFHLHAVKHTDEKSGVHFQQSRLISSPKDAMELDGTIHNMKTGADTAFRVWFDRTSLNALPLRFEFQPKSYLRLMFEAVADGDPAVVKAFADLGTSPQPASASLSRTALR